VNHNVFQNVYLSFELWACSITTSGPSISDWLWRMVPPWWCWSLPDTAWVLKQWRILVLISVVKLQKPLIVYPSREHKWRRYDCWTVIYLHFLNCDCLDIDWKSCTVYMGEMKGTSCAHFPVLYSDVSFVNALLVCW
jgi:hypothetical protein